MFATCPEMFAAQLICEKMGVSEAISIKGARQYSKYTGYGGTMEYGGGSTHEY